MGRRCRDCSECCTALVVEDVPTDAFERCKHQCARGCAVYANRPKPCAVFECQWLMGHWATCDRPDKSGVVMTAEEHPSLPEGRLLYKAHVTRETERGSRLLHGIANYALVYIIFRDGRTKIAGPKEDIASFTQWAKATGVPFTDGQRP